MQYPSFVGGSYVSAAITADQEDTINWYVELMEVPGATTRATLYPTPGVTELADYVDGVGKAHFFEGSREFAVVGGSFIEIDSAGSTTLRGTVATGTAPATICSNGPQGGAEATDTGEIFITAGGSINSDGVGTGGNGYIFNLKTNVFSQVRTGATFQGGMLDGYFLALDADTNAFFISGLLDGLTWDASQFARRSSASDPWRALKVMNPYIYLLGQHTSSAWYDAGSSPFPFAEHPSGRIPYGVAAPFSPAIAEGSLYWLASTESGIGPVVRATGFTPKRVSTHPVDLAIDGYSDITDAVGDSYEEAGHRFYLLTMPTGKITWVYDERSRLWHKRGTWSSIDSTYGAWRPQFHAYAHGQHRMLDNFSGKIYSMSNTDTTDAGGEILRRVRRAPAMEFENKRLYYSRFELGLQRGLGLTSGQGSNPQVMMRISNDGGHTWGNERWASAGKLGDYNIRVEWNRCGMGRRRVFEIVMSDPIPWRITNAWVEMTSLPKGVNPQAAVA